MTTFLVIIAVIIIAVIIYQQYKKSVPTGVNNENSKIKGRNHVGVYKTKGVKSFVIRGAQYRHLKSSDTGRFIGNVRTEENSHDKYAVAIYSNKNVHLGYIPKGNIRMHKTLEELHNGKLLAWGYIDYWERENEWKGLVYIPVGINLDEMELLSEFLRLQERIDVLSRDRTLPISKKLEVLEAAYEANERCNLLKDYDKFSVEFPKTFIPSVSLELEKNNDWANLANLDRYIFLINELNEKSRNSILKRIDTAKRKTE